MVAYFYGVEMSVVSSDFLEFLFKEEAIVLFHIDQLLFGKDLHTEDRDHFLEIIAIAVVRLFVAGRPDAAAVMSK